MGFADDVETALEEVVSGMPGGGEARSGQRAMARAVAETVEDGGHLVVQAGTGTGKTLAYLLAAALSGRRTVVATFTKALQDQMVEADLPMVGRHIRSTTGRDFSFAEVKGWNNYLCQERIDEIRSSTDQGQLDGLVEGAPSDEVDRIMSWADTTLTGDRADLDFTPTDRTWQALSVSSAECLGTADCPFAGSCFPLMARRQAAEVDVSVANHALYAVDLEIGGFILGGHDLVILDEAHQVEESFTQAFGLRLTGGRLRWLSDLARRVLGQDDAVGKVRELGERLVVAMTNHGTARVYTGEAAGLTKTLELAEARIESLLTAVTGSTSGDDELSRRRKRLLKVGGALLEDIQTASRHLAGPAPSDLVAWIEMDDGRRPVLRIVPVTVGPLLEEILWSRRTAVLTSATIPKNIVDRLGLTGSDPRTEDFGSPFDYENQTLLYCADQLPDPSTDREAWMVGALGELEALIVAAGGRTLALFTSFDALSKAREHLVGRLDFPVLVQGERPPKMLLEEFAAEEESCLLATRRFWQGIDIPGPSLTLLVINRLPFPSPNEYLVKTWSDLADPGGWWTVELPIGATRLAQAAGRLVRKMEDQGVVAVLDPRLAGGSYRRELLDALPPMAKTTDREEVERFLRRLRDG